MATYLKPLLVLALFFAGSASALVSQHMEGIAVYAFIEGYEDFDVDDDGSTLILGYYGVSKAVFRVYLPPQFGSHYIDYLRITVDGTGTMEEIKFGGPTAVYYTDVEDGETFVFPNPEHPTIEISDLLEPTGDSLSGNYLRIQIDETSTGPNYKLHGITVEYNYAGVSDPLVEHFMESYEAYLHIKDASETIYASWEKDEQLTELMFWLGMTRALTTVASTGFNEVAGGLISWGIGNILSHEQIATLITDGMYFWANLAIYTGYFPADLQSMIQTACFSGYQECMQLAVLWRQSIDNDEMDVASLLTRISTLKAKIDNIEWNLNFAKDKLYVVYSRRWPPIGNREVGSGMGDYKAEMILRSFAALVAYDFGETQPPTARSNIYTTKFKDLLSTQESYIHSNYCAVAASAGAHGGVVPSGTTYVKSGGSATFNATPNAGYVVDKWYVNDQPQAGSEGQGSLTVSNIQGATMVRVTFRLAQLIIQRPAANPYITADSEVTCWGTAPIGTCIVRWQNTKTGKSGDTGDPPGTTWRESIPIEEGSNTITFTAEGASRNVLASASIEVRREGSDRMYYSPLQRWITSGEPKRTFDGLVYVGCDPVSPYGGNERGLVRLNLGASDFPPGSTVLSAEFRAETSAPGYQTGSGTMGVTVGRITGLWSNDSVCWNEQPSTTTSGQSTKGVSDTGNERVAWDVTNIAQAWRGGASIEGLMMISESENIDYQLERVFSNDGFLLKVTLYVERELPQIEITSPTSGPSYCTGLSSVSLAGTAWDYYGVRRVEYRNHTTGESGTASGTTSWSCTVDVNEGLNTISAIAYDMSENSDSDTITVLRLTPPTGVSASSDIIGHVLVQWEPVAEAGYYCVYRSDSETGTKYAVSCGIDALSFADTSVVWGDSYYYWVAASADSTGSCQSDYGGPAIGKRLAPLDPELSGDDVVNFMDFAVLAAQWMQACSGPNSCAGCDLNLSGEVDWPDVQIIADTWLRETQHTPEDMVPIPGGTFEMGDNLASSDERPVHTVTVDSFYMGEFEVTNQQYCDYLNSAQSQGLITVTDGVVYQAGSGTSYPYCDMHTSSSSSQIDYNDVTQTFSVRTKSSRNMSNDPMVMVSWYGAAAYCNWRSQQEGKEQCYNLSTWNSDFSKKGYRLATEAEWEYAARGGLSGRRFPWGDTITHSQANYYSDSNYSYDISPTTGYHPTWNDGVVPYTSPVSTFAANGYGLYDMAGNVWDRCNDWYSGSYYSSSPTSNPTGPDGPLTNRVIRGGCWDDPATSCRVANRGYFRPVDRGGNIGFRILLPD